MMRAGPQGERLKVSPKLHKRRPKENIEARAGRRRWEARVAGGAMPSLEGAACKENSSAGIDANQVLARVIESIGHFPEPVTAFCCFRIASTALSNSSPRTFLARMTPSGSST